MQQVRQLSNEFSPTHYDIRLALHRTERKFTGTVRITGTLHRDQAIPLHAKDLVITKALVDGAEAESTTGKDDEIAISSSTPITEGDHTIELSFEGKITDSMHGLYPCYFKNNGEDEELLATQFESHHAREVFPCIDEPAAKATFTLTLLTEKGITTLANTPVRKREVHETWLVSTFEQTPKMSTYLLAFTCGKLEFLEATTKDGVVVRTYTTPGNSEKTSFALETAVRTLELYNDYFGVPYPLKKCDMIGLPDFSSGAMENWGLITYRESALFVDPTSSTSTKQRVAEVVAHELAHQWFGNLVTMQWWNDLWLNESFATWMAYYAQDKLFPDWQVWIQFFNEETSYALDRDALTSIQSVQQEVNHPDEIQTLFDPAIVYAKGASLVHMVHAYMGDDAFRKGIADYMNAHRYSNTVADDLWTAWSKASGKDIAAFMNPWIRQSGHPVVDVVVADKKATLTQRRFLSNPKDAAKDARTWPIPLLATPAITTELLTGKTGTFTIVDSSKPLMLNSRRTGFYLPLYDEAHLAALSSAIATGHIDIIDRLALLSEAYDLAKAGQQSTLHMLKLLEAYKDETAEPVWNAIASATGALKTIIELDPTLKPALRTFIHSLAESQYKRLGWTRIEGEPYFDELLRPTIISLMGYSEDPAVIAKANELLAAASSPEDILGDIRANVFSIAARLGSDKGFTTLLGWVKEQQTPEVYMQITAGLCSTSNVGRIEQLIPLLKSKYVKTQDLFYWVAYLSRNFDARPIIWKWMTDEWQWIMDTYGNDMHYTIFPRYFAGAFSTKEGLESFKAFFEPKLAEPALQREIKQGLENIEARIQWRERDFEDVAAYLSK